MRDEGGFANGNALANAHRGDIIVMDLPITPLHMAKSCTAAQKRFAIAMPLAVAF